MYLVIVLGKPQLGSGGDADDATAFGTSEPAHAGKPESASADWTIVDCRKPPRWGSPSNQFEIVLQRCSDLEIGREPKQAQATAGGPSGVHRRRPRGIRGVSHLGKRDTHDSRGNSPLFAEVSRIMRDMSEEQLRQMLTVANSLSLEEP